MPGYFYVVVVLFPGECCTPHVCGSIFSIIISIMLFSFYCGGPRMQRQMQPLMESALNPTLGGFPKGDICR